MKYKKRTNLNEPSTYILLALMSEPLSGYDIARRVIQLTEGRIEIKTGIMYPTLSSLNNLGYIKQVEEKTIGRNKKIYDITEQGKSAIANEVDKLEMMLLEMQSAIQGGRAYEKE
jgi:DNA-binding PadR family transcriptional regulator